MEICLTPNHLLFGRHSLYSSNIASTVLRNLTILSSTTDKINHIVITFGVVRNLTVVGIG